MSLKSILALLVLFNCAAQACSPWDPRGCKPKDCSFWDPRCSNPPIFSHNRFYAGVSLGQTNIVGSLKRLLEVGSNDKTTSLGGTGFTPGIFAGYGHVLDMTPIYVGVEASYRHDDITITKEENTWPNFVEYITKIQKKDSWGAAGKLGFVHKDNIFYFKAGIVSTRFILGFEDRSNRASAGSTTLRRKGILLGVGMDYTINNNWALGAEFERVHYPSMQFTNANIGRFNFKPKTYSYLVRLKYSF